MKSGIRRGTAKSGLRPGSILYIGKPRTEKPRIRIIDYSETELKEIEAQSATNCLQYRDSPTVTWLRIDGLHDTTLVETIGTHYGLHPLALEDIVNTEHSPKFEESAESVLIVLKSLSYNSSLARVETQHVAVVFGSNFVITFAEQDCKPFDHVLDRIKNTPRRKRHMGADFLAYSLIDSLIDDYFVTLEGLSDEIEAVEEKIIDRPQARNLEAIHDLKASLITMRRASWPLRDIFSELRRIESPLLHDYTRPYLRDLYEHINQVLDTVETFREMVSGLLEVYLSSVSIKTNQAMKVLTVVATIFIPLGFLAGVYGMNFNTSVSPFNMPELSMKYGYLMFWGVCIAALVGMLWFFRKRQWL
jgi:magnesium transporter